MTVVTAPMPWNQDVSITDAPLVSLMSRKFSEYPEGLDERGALVMLVDRVDRLRIEEMHAGRWDVDNPTVFYVDKTLRWGKAVLNDCARPAAIEAEERDVDV